MEGLGFSASKLLSIDVPVFCVGTEETSEYSDGLFVEGSDAYWEEPYCDSLRCSSIRTFCTSW